MAGDGAKRRTRRLWRMCVKELTVLNVEVQKLAPGNSLLVAAQALPVTVESVLERVQRKGKRTGKQPDLKTKTGKPDQPGGHRWDQPESVIWNSGLVELEGGDGREPWSETSNPCGGEIATLWHRPRQVPAPRFDPLTSKLYHNQHRAELAVGEKNRL